MSEGGGRFSDMCWSVQPTTVQEQEIHLFALLKSQIDTILMSVRRTDLEPRGDQLSLASTGSWVSSQLSFSQSFTIYQHLSSPLITMLYLRVYLFNMYKKTEMQANVMLGATCYMLAIAHNFKSDLMFCTG